MDYLMDYYKKECDQLGELPSNYWRNDGHSLYKFRIAFYQKFIKNLPAIFEMKSKHWCGWPAISNLSNQDLHNCSGYQTAIETQLVGYHCDLDTANNELFVQIKKLGLTK